MATGMTETERAAFIGYGLGVFTVVIGLPLFSWVLLATLPQARVVLHRKISGVIDSKTQKAVNDLSGGLGQVVNGVVIPAVDAAFGRPWQSTVHALLSAPVADYVIEEKLGLPGIPAEMK